MIDMRTDLGEVQHDGFEYNWRFRDNHWHSQIGKLGAGAWVRRRRWVRLMMRPANHTHGHSAPCNGIRTTIPFSPSLACPASKPSLVELDHHVWDGGEQDWHYVHRLLRQLGRDGRKLELWRVWLGPHTHASDSKAKGKQSDAPSLSSQDALEKRLSDVVPEGNPPPLVHLITILRDHVRVPPSSLQTDQNYYVAQGEAILRSFVFPDSRAQFVDLVRQAGLAQDLEICLGRAFSAADVDFWSYTDNLDKL